MDYSKYYTPLPIAKLLINQLKISPPEKIVDICCGSCNLLNAAKMRWSKTVLYGTDIADHIVSNVIFENTDGRTYALKHQNEFPLVLANPPFDYLGKKSEFPQLFQPPFDNCSSSRLEVEMLIANLIMLRDEGILLIIMPSSFVEGETHNEVRKIIAKYYQIKAIIELDERTFGASYIHSYALIVKKRICKRYICKLMYAKKSGDDFSLHQIKEVTSRDLAKGHWNGRQATSKLNGLDIKRGSVSSSDFTEEGQAILHTAKLLDEWQPSVRRVAYNVKSNAYAEEGDIVVSRIGKSAGKWCVYSGEKIPISDCLYRIKDADGKLYEKIQGKTFNLKLRGVATQFITMSDFKNWIDSL